MVRREAGVPRSLNRCMSSWMPSGLPTWKLVECQLRLVFEVYQPSILPELISCQYRAKITDLNQDIPYQHPACWSWDAVCEIGSETET